MDDSWQHQLWLDILDDSRISPIEYEDFLSPSGTIRGKAPVKTTAIGGTPFKADVAFSWLIKNKIDELECEASKLRGKVPYLAGED